MADMENNEKQFYQDTSEKAPDELPTDTSMSAEILIPDNTNQNHPSFDSVLPVSIIQKRVLVIAVILLLGGVFLITSRTVRNISTLQQPTPVPRDTTNQFRQTYYNEHYKVIVPIPTGWSGELNPSHSEEFIALKPINFHQICFPDVSQCPIVLEFKDNPTQLIPDQFGQPFYPATEDIYGGSEDMTVASVPALVLYNINDTGGRIVYLRRPDSIVKITLQNDNEVPFEFDQTFEELLKQIQFAP